MAVAPVWRAVGNQLREKFWVGPVIHGGGAVRGMPVHRAGDPGSNTGPGKNFSLKINNIMNIFVCLVNAQGFQLYLNLTDT